MPRPPARPQIILFNQGDTPARSVTLTDVTAVPPAGSAFTTITIPVVGVSFAAGETLSQPGTTATVAVVNDPQANVIAELDGRERPATSSWPEAISTPSRQAPGSTTTAPARRHCSRRR